MVSSMLEKFSTPLASPFYPRPPYLYKDAELFLALFNPTEESLEKMLPDPLKPSQLPLAALLFGKMPCVETGTFIESALLVQCVFENIETGEEEVGVYFSHNYVDTDIAQACGREIWGYPRKIAKTTMRWRKDTLTASTKRDGNTLFKAKCKFDDEGEWIDSGPNVNIKVIPSVTGESFDLAVVTAAYLTYDIRNGRSGEVNLEINGGPDDDFSLVEIDTPMLGIYFDCDIHLPPGKVVAKLKS